MITFNTNLRYSLRLLANLALSGKLPKQLKKIAKEEGISLPYLRKLTIPLEKSGILKSLKGPGGGFLLNRDPSTLYLSELMDILTKSKIVKCVKDSSSCKRYGDCLVIDLLEEVYDKVQSIFKKKTLATMLKRRKR